MIEPIAPMLATPSKNVANNPSQAVTALHMAGYYGEPKLDGVRALIYIDGDDTRIINRRGVDIGGRYPDILAALTEYGTDRTMVLDGEIVCLGEDGQPDFAKIHRRDAQAVTNTAKNAHLAATIPATFIAFDIPHNYGDTRLLPYTARRAMLRTIGLEEATGTLRRIVSHERMDVLWSFAQQHGLEGLIAKHPASAYGGGRSSQWVKLKTTESVSVVAVGYNKGEGSRANTIGAINIAMIEDGKIVDVGRVGTGFKERDLVDLQARMDAGEMLVLEVEYANWGRTSRKLRFPAFKMVRTDVLPTDCTTDQLNPLLAMGDDAVAMTSKVSQR